MSKGYSGLFEGTSGAGYERGQLPIVLRNPVLEAIYREEHEIRMVYGKYSTKLNEDKQGKHIPGHKNYQEGKSVLTISMDDAQRLVNRFAGSGRMITANREKVNCHKIIGRYINEQTGANLPTSWISIHYSKTGAHIVPANPEEY